MNRWRRFLFPLLALSSFWFAGCGAGDESAPAENAVDGSPALDHVRLQANWYAQTEHGGFHYGIATGIYEKYGIDLEILGAGPGVKIVQKVALGDADFAMQRFDSVIQAIDKGIPIVTVASFMFHDAAAFMVREDSPVEKFEDLDGRKVMLGVGSTFEMFFRRRYEINFRALPFTWGYGEFMIDPELSQQCYVTNEPYFVGREGVKTRLLPFYESGYDPFQVILSSKSYVEANPDLTRRFLAATIESWVAFLTTDDPEPAFASIQKHNPKMSHEHMAYAYEVLKRDGYILGQPEDDFAFGSLPDSKVQPLVTILQDLDMVEDTLTVGDIVDRSFLPPEAAQP